jgi:hypothetical protein
MTQALFPLPPATLYPALAQVQPSLADLYPAIEPCFYPQVFLFS